MDPHGPNQPIEKGLCEEPNLGVLDGRQRVRRQGQSNGQLERVTLYSIMEDPQTSCGCFECIVGVIPETNGVMVVNREYQGMTPLGMTFSTLAGEVGGGVQTPGFLGSRADVPGQREVHLGRGRAAAAGLDAEGTQG